MLTAIRDVRPLFQAPNLLWAVNMPSQGTPDGSAPDDWYYYNFVRDIGDGLGPIIPGQFTGPGQINAGNIPNTITAHCYGYDTLCQVDGNRPTKVLNFIRNWNLEMNIKVTEAGINSRDLAESGEPGLAERGRRYVDFGESVLPGQFGNVDSVTFYTLGDADPTKPEEVRYNMSDAEAQQIGLRARAGLC